MNRIEGASTFRPAWPEPDPARMARDFMVWRHLRVVRARAMRHLRGALTLRSEPVRTVYGVQMWSNWSDRTFAYCSYGTYGNYLADLLASIGTPFAFLDVGANQGLFSLIAGQNPACEAIVALEPVPDTHARLAANLELNGLAERARALNFGLSDKAESRAITLSKAHSGMATLSSHGDALPGEHDHIPVKLATMAELGPHLPRDLPIFVKIDVEGHEETVIRELLAWPEAGRLTAIFYEQDDRWSDNSAIMQVLTNSGFDRKHIYGRGRHYDVLAVPTGAR
jgi:FkbM family methyltransferase